jgi:hypothetical protein
LMIDASFIFLYTPILYFLLIYFQMYRHDLGRFAHPFRDHDTRRDWVLVFKKLGVVPSTTPVPGYGEDIARLVPVVALGAGLSLAGPFLSFGVWYQAIMIQVISAFVLFTAISQLLGPAANRARRDHMKYHRLGSRIMELPKNLDGEKYD